MDDIVIAQLTDLHVAPPTDAIFGQNFDRLDACLARISKLMRQPDLLLLTGDLTEYGDDETLKTLIKRIERVGIPTQFSLGNHDVAERDSQSIRREFSFDTETLIERGSTAKLRILSIDTGRSGRHGGELSQDEAENLLRSLNEQKKTETLLAIHHPPCEIGIDWMDPAKNVDWQARLRDVVLASPQVVGIVCGHVHASAHTVFAGVRLCVTPAVAQRSHVEVHPIDIDNPDGRVLIEQSPPAFALHRFFRGSWTTFIVYADESEPLLNFDDRRKALIRMTKDIDI